MLGRFFMGNKYLNRYNIALLAANLQDPFSEQLSMGAMRAAERLDVDLCIIPGKYVGIDYEERDPDSKYDYQNNSMFYTAAAGKFDFIIAAVGSVAYSYDAAKKDEFLHLYDGTPILSVAAETNVCDYIQYDNRTGIISTMDHLIEKEGKKHIGMLVGDLNNFECAERYNAYLHSLEKHGLDYDKRFVMSCDLSSYCTKEVEELLRRCPDMDALICANDVIASAVYRVVHKVNRHIGRDLAVVGFDDIPLASKMDPPLASVRADAYKMGVRAVEKAVSHLNGKSDKGVMLPTEFIPRASCCSDPMVVNSRQEVLSGGSAEMAERIYEYLHESFSGKTDKKLVTDYFTAVIDCLDRHFVKRAASEDDLHIITDLTDEFFESMPVIVDITLKIENVIQGLYGKYTLECPDENRKYLVRLNEYFHRRITTLIISDYRQLQEKHREQQYMLNLVIRDTLMFQGNLSISYASILKQLHHIGIKTCYLYLLEKPVVYHNGDVFYPENVQWKFKSYCYGNDFHMVPEEEQSITPDMLFNNKYLPYNRRFTAITVDLYIAEKQYGILLCEPEDSGVFDRVDMISYQMSTAIREIELLISQEEMMTKLYTSNLALENMSRIDELTGIYNRRGFYSAAEKLITDSKNKGRKLIVCYADMDNLKMVNDKFGHIEGDFSLRSLAECLSELFGKNSVVGRIGGDEYSAVAFADKMPSPDELLAKKDALIGELNKKAGKNYHIGMSMGIYSCVCESIYDLKDAMDKADDLLYSVKKNRKKEI